MWTFRMEDWYMQHIKIIVFAGLVALLVWGCIEDIEPKGNQKPMVWFTRGPANGSVVFQNAVTFEWNASDWDDDLGMGKTEVKLEPDEVEWFDAQAGSTVTFRHPEGWVRVYDDVYDILDLPDSTFTFSVRVTDDRGADSTLTRHFFVRYDPFAPEITSVEGLEGRLDDPNACATFRITAHDVAREARGATPPESLEYSWRFVRPLGLPALESQPQWDIHNNTIDLCIDGQAYPGQYRFRCQVRDRAGNVSPERVLICEYNRTGLASGSE
jgi:hypothetical protein